MLIGREIYIRESFVTPAAGGEVKLALGPGPNNDMFMGVNALRLDLELGSVNGAFVDNSSAFALTYGPNRVPYATVVTPTGTPSEVTAGDMTISLLFLPIPGCTPVPPLRNCLRGVVSRGRVVVVQSYWDGPEGL